MTNTIMQKSFSSASRECNRLYNYSSSRIEQRFLGPGVLPSAPTPPPAAPSSVASFSGYQAGFPQIGPGQGGYGQGGFPQRASPLGQFEQIPQSTQPPSYNQAPRNCANQLASPPGFNVGWQYTDPMAEQQRRLSAAPAGTIVSATRIHSGDIVESRSRHMNEQYHYQKYEQARAPPGQQAALPPGSEASVPVMLCHTCSDCGRLRSAGFHRNNPVLPGKPLILLPCRRCERKAVNRRSTYTRIRSCTADEPCGWPREPVNIDVDYSDRRGRRRDREEVYVTRYSPSRPRILQRSVSQAHLGLRTLQQPPRPLKTETMVRVSSLSPRRTSRYDKTWPPPDVVPTKHSRSNAVFSPPSDPFPSRAARTDEVWPPPDAVPTHSYRKVESSQPPLRRVSSRIIELSPSPPPARTRATRVMYQSESLDRRSRSRSASPARISVREQRRSEDVQARITAHPRPYRTVIPEHRTLFRESDETTSQNESTSHRRAESPSRSILKPGGMDYETHRRRMSMRDSQQSIAVEVGGPRVQFATDRREDRSAPAKGKTRYANEEHTRGRDYERYHDYSRHRYVENRSPPPAPPTEAFESLHIRQSSPASRRSYEEEIRIDRARRISPSPPPPRGYEEIRVRHVSPAPRPSRTTQRPPSPPTPDRPVYSGYRHVSRTRTMGRTRSVTPPPARRQVKEDLENLTDSDSAASGEVTEVRTWKGIDENGQPATFVEERRTMRMIEQGSERGGPFAAMSERLASRTWRDV